MTILSVLLSPDGIQVVTVNESDNNNELDIDDI